MTKKIRFSLFIAALVLCQTSASFAYTINYDSTNATDGSVLTSPYSWVTVYTFNKTSDSGPYTFPTTISGGAYVSGFYSGNYAAPAISSSSVDSTQYLTTYGGGSTTVTFGSLFNYLGLFWGSMDSYNYLSFYNNDKLLFSLSGNNVTGNANGTQYYSPTNQYVNIFSDESFNKIVMTSESNSFEIDNLAVGTAPIPEPATMLLFGVGLVGLGGALRKKHD